MEKSFDFNENLLAPNGISKEFSDRLKEIGIDVEPTKTEHLIVRNGKPSDHPEDIEDIDSSLKSSFSIDMDYNLFLSNHSPYVTEDIRDVYFIVEDLNEAFRLKYFKKRFKGSFFNATLDTYVRPAVARVYKGIQFKPGYGVMFIALDKAERLPETDVYGRKVMNLEQFLDWLGEDIVTKQMIWASVDESVKPMDVCNEHIYERLLENVNEIPDKFQFIFKLNKGIPKSKKTALELKDFLCSAYEGRKHLIEHEVLELVQLIGGSCFNSQTCESKFKDTFDSIMTAQPAVKE